jgi:hypothetical protein
MQTEVQKTGADNEKDAIGQAEVFCPSEQIAHQENIGQEDWVYLEKSPSRKSEDQSNVVIWIVTTLITRMLYKVPTAIGE